MFKYIYTIIFLSIFLITSLPVLAEGNLLTVTDLLVDKTAKNAVVARKEAISEAKRLAFQQLAQRNMSPEAFEYFQAPDDSIISLLVQDFSITSEQLSATRYVAKFTVRFQDDVKNYITIKAAPTITYMSQTLNTTEPRALLILPYYENIGGQALLWEDPNPWREVWQTFSPQINGWQITIPLGDISDITTGSSEDVWTGEYTAVEELREKYTAEEVILCIVNTSGAQLVLDIYSYKNNTLERLTSLTPYVGDEDEKGALRIAMRAVITFLQQESNDTNTASLTVETLTPTNDNLSIEAEMSFNSFAQWIDAQKRLAATTPPTTIQLKALSSSSAAFSLSFNGDFTGFKTTLAEQGMILGQPTIDVGTSIMGNAQSTRKMIYDLQLIN